MSLSTICTKALKGMSGFNVPPTFYSSSDLTAVLCVALANESGQDLEKEIRWSQLITEYTFTTVSGTATYALPTDFRAFGNMSQWDRTNLWRMTGPVPSMVYQWLKSGISVAAANNRWFMIRGSTFTVFPTPTTTGDTLAFDYYSKNWVTKQVDLSATSEWSADNDTSKLDEDLHVADLKWRFLQAKGMPFETEYKRFEALKELLVADNGGKGVIDLGMGPRMMGIGGLSSYGNLPDTGFGS